MSRISRVLVGAALVGCGGGGSPSTPDAEIVPPDADVSGLSAIPLTTPDGSYYTAPVALGSQVFAMDVDTGSTTTGVAMMGCGTCGVTPLYTPGSTATDQHQTASTVYADNSGWSGEIWQDKMSLQQMTADVDTKIVGITQQNGFFDGYNYEGILGVGPPEALEDGTSSWLVAADAAGQTAVVSFEMCDDTGGTMWVGGYDPAAPSAAPQYAPMFPIDPQVNFFYSIGIADLGLGGTSLGYDASTFGETVVDSGTSRFYIPLAVETKLLQEINGNPAYSTLLTQPLVDDDNGTGCVPAVSGVTAAQIDATLPPLNISFPAVGGGTFSFDIPPTRSYLYDTHDGNFCLTVFDDYGDGPVIGDTFMRAFVTVFDIGNHRVGFAPDAGCAAAQKPGPLAPRAPIVEHGHGPLRLRHR